MITRLVKMTFRPGQVDHFLEIFEESKQNIRGFEGCHYLELLRDEDQPNVFFTYSIWESADHLEGYRQSELFQNTWAKTKKLFADRPEAWTTQTVESIE